MNDLTIEEEAADVVQRLKNYNARGVLVGGFDFMNPVIKDAIKLIGKLAPEPNYAVNGFYIKDEDNVPEELTKAKERGEEFQLRTVIGWIDIPPADFDCFRVLNIYRIKQQGE